MILRAITGSVIVSVILASIWFGPQYFQYLWLILMFKGFLEAQGLHKIDSMRMTCFCASGIWLGTSLGFVASQSVSLLVGGCLLSLFLFFSMGIMDFKEESRETFYAKFSSSLVTFLYIGVFYTPVLYIAVLGARPKEFLLLIFAIMWLQDSFAYLGGRLFGKHRMSPDLSPNKTWEGAIIGLAIACLIIGLVNLYFPRADSLALIILVVSVGIAGQIGDLMESFLKRSFNVKDSGQIFPGHGGVLDRFDSVVAGSIVFLVITLMEVV